MKVLIEEIVSIPQDIPRRRKFRRHRLGIYELPPFPVSVPLSDLEERHITIADEIQRRRVIRVMHIELAIVTPPSKSGPGEIGYIFEVIDGEMPDYGKFREQERSAEMKTEPNERES
jgi:hypothetical protein